MEQIGAIILAALTLGISIWKWFTDSAMSKKEAIDAKNKTIDQSSNADDIMRESGGMR